MTVYDSLHALLDCQCLFFHGYRLGSGLRIVHFFSFRCPLVSTTQLNTQLLNSLTLHYDSLTTELWLPRSESESYVRTDGLSASLSWNKAPIWGLRPDLDYCLTVAGLLIWGVLSDERTGLSFAIATGPRQRSHFRVRVPWNSLPYFTVSDSRLPFSSPPTTRRVTVEVFDPASTRSLPRSSLYGSSYRLPVTTENVRCHGNVLTEQLASNGLFRCCGNLCLASCWLAMDFRSGSTIPAFRRHVTIECESNIKSASLV
jgi:hypothetical protein